MTHLRCSLGRHEWIDGRNDDGERYRECGRCGAIENEFPVGTSFTLGPPGG
jgi:hypothetical protein